jgi:uncharacterized membrane protein YhiD involved in acid resistance
MTNLEILIGVGVGIISLLIALLTYFANKWVDGLETSISQNTKDIQFQAKQLSKFEKSQQSATEKISETIHTKIATLKFPYSKIDEMLHEIGRLNNAVYKTIIPDLENQKQNNGKITVLENQITEQNTKLVTMHSAIKLVIEKLKDPK